MSFSKRMEGFNFLKFFTIEHFLAGVSFEAVFLLNIIVNDQPAPELANQGIGSCQYCYLLRYINHTRPGCLDTDISDYVQNCLSLNHLFAFIFESSVAFISLMQFTHHPCFSHLCASKRKVKSFSSCPDPKILGLRLHYTCLESLWF